ncbi:hypothetical protein B0H17DRAFT_1130125 [Mycena rosella]|uniref:DUF6589 domain-containing protein n=1 Tax=Mycena rosella TaxID=1033263 RepID=A0AAD7DTQ4_MYCRO|nr:hypothetical protein B0H17DRAFT_1130125 [Mycena rosella]
MPTQPDMGRTLITSMILNLRSRETNLHGAMNTLILWDGCVPKQLVQTLNHYGSCTSYLYQTKAVGTISKDGVRPAKCAANNPENLLLLPYDNFNWMQTAYKTSAIHGNVSHDQLDVLPVLRTLNKQPQPSPSSSRSSIGGNPPTHLDQQTDNAIKHVGKILADELAAFLSHRNDLIDFFDPHALPITKTEEYFLPTYDQEQSSTRGNMLVIDHYYPGPVLRIPKHIFEARYSLLFGDRLTTAWDRAAQDQRAVDRSEHRIQNLGKDAWGGGSRGAVSLLTLLEKLPNRSNMTWDWASARRELNL